MARIVRASRSSPGGIDLSVDLRIATAPRGFQAHAWTIRAKVGAEYIEKASIRRADMFRKIPQAVALFLTAGLVAILSSGKGGADTDITGRWDLTMGNATDSYPSWLEVTRKDGKLAGRFVGKAGSARPVRQMEFADGQLNFSLPPQYEKFKGTITFSAVFADDQLKGTTKGEDGTLPFTGVRAPLLPRSSNPRWGNPLVLFNGKTMAGWKPKNPKLPNGWKVVNGVMENHTPSSDIITEQEFMDFKLHVEFNVAPKSNSGVYLRGRYEVQIQDDYGKPAESHFIGGVYGFIDPLVNAARKAQEWQSYDITLLGRWVTVVLNGRTVIDNKEIPGITGGALHSREGEPGPLMLQGDHGDVLYRNIVLTAAEKD